MRAMRDLPVKTLRPLFIPETSTLPPPRRHGQIFWTRMLGSSSRPTCSTVCVYLQLLGPNTLPTRTRHAGLEVKVQPDIFTYTCHLCQRPSLTFVLDSSVQHVGLKFECVWVTPNFSWLELVSSWAARSTVFVRLYTAISWLIWSCCFACQNTSLR